MKKNTLALFNTGKNVIQQSRTPENTVTAIRKVFNSGMEMALVVKVPNHSRKADYSQTLNELNKMGINQRVASFFTGVSQSYISKLGKK